MPHVSVSNTVQHLGAANRSAEEATVLRDDIFTAGWNVRAGKLPGMHPIPPRAPGQNVNGVTPSG
ncbi:hypothetical protein OG762_40185 [Streptomyces sp. NBC_01136]|uniref:hypothetical protein n=1 Tax=unclassified Streptomyces TaxID=2593676 RepID=UPI00324841B2|nr:hypothetical protein OG762_40185 [Streptomyces sp. NBC_01136]